MAALALGGCSAESHPASTDTSGAAMAAADPSPSSTSSSLPPLKPHPRVVVALAPGQEPPPGVSAAYGPSGEASNFTPPSDAQVKHELAQLNTSKLSGSGAYTDPFAHIANLTPERIDMGVDYSGTGPVVALGDGTVFNTAGPGWPGGNFIGIRLSGGPYAGLAYFVAEDVKPTVHVGDHVRAGQEIAVMYGGPSGIETGWAAGNADEPLAAALGQQGRGGDPGGWSSAAGLSFDRLLVSTGTPSGIPQGSAVHGTMPPRYP